MSALAVTRDDASAPFYDAATRGELLLRRCADCVHWAAPRAVACPACGSARLTWEPARGDATLVSWTVVHGRPPAEGGEAPRTVAGLVELAEGPWLHGRLTGVADPGSLTCGQRLVLAFERPGGGEAVPVFRPAL
ncbi:Zn-ribbon domain-containing OB-fold protein [Streptomyces sp. DT195]|uniref:Zn-ribbon domain-containing OB-fold protein n=1 Tax=Streptomyces sp. DT195 TaxID=3393419 RepID=UPI003CFAC6BB